MTAADHSNSAAQLLQKLKQSIPSANETIDQEVLVEAALIAIRNKRDKLAKSLDAAEKPVPFHQQSTEDAERLLKENKNLQEEVDAISQMMQMTIEHITQAHETAIVDIQNEAAEEKLAGEEKQIQLAEKNEELSSTIQDLYQQIEQSQSGWEQKEQEYQKQVVQQADQVKKLQEDTESYQKSILSKEEELKTLTEANEALSSQLENLMTKKQHLEQQMRADLEALKQQVQIAAKADENNYRGSQKALENSIDFTQKLNQSCFKHEATLQKLFPHTAYFALPEATYNGNLLYVAEKFGVTYLVMVRALFEGLEGQIFKMVSNFAINNIIKVKKYINSSKLIEEFFYSINSSLQLLEHPEGSIEIGVCLIDKTNLELEFSSTGFPIYAEGNNGELLDVAGGKNTQEDALNKRFGLNNTYKVKKINLLPKQCILLSSADLSLPMEPISSSEEDTQSLGDHLSQNLHKEKQLFNSHLKELFDSYKLATPKADTDFLLARVSF